MRALAILVIVASCAIDLPRESVGAQGLICDPWCDEDDPNAPVVAGAISMATEMANQWSSSFGGSGVGHCDAVFGIAMCEIVTTDVHCYVHYADGHLTPAGCW